MKVFCAKRAGFCFGVKRAINMAFEVATVKKGGVYTFGPLIHNPQVVEKLKNAGVEPVNSVAKLEKKTVKAVIIRTHGIPLDVMEGLLAAGYEIIDATCPFVKKAQQYAKLLYEKGYQVVILGDRHHPEVEGILSYAGERAVVVNPSRKIPRVETKVGVVVQTTQPIDSLKKLLSDIIDDTKELKVHNTICNSTALRLKETESLARKMDVMIVVGGKNSANTTQLANLCSSLSVPTHHIETSEELEAGWFKGVGSVGLTAGASTPDWIIRDIKDRIKNIRRKPL